MKSQNFHQNGSIYEGTLWGEQTCSVLLQKVLILPQWKEEPWQVCLTWTLFWLSHEEFIFAYIDLLFLLDASRSSASLISLGELDDVNKHFISHRRGLPFSFSTPHLAVPAHRRPLCSWTITSDKAGFHTKASQVFWGLKLS